MASNDFDVEEAVRKTTEREESRQLLKDAHLQCRAYYAASLKLGSKYSFMPCQWKINEYNRCMNNKDLNKPFCTKHEMWFEKGIRSEGMVCQSVGETCFLCSLSTCISGMRTIQGGPMSLEDYKHLLSCMTEAADLLFKQRPRNE